ncbi:MAG: ATP-binding cassette domain-containing protein [Fidelibacterota bacterium]
MEWENQILLDGVNFRSCSNSILENISLTLRARSRLGITGPSGSGKSTLLRLMNGLLSPTRGTVYFRGKPLSSYNPFLARKKICLIQQKAVFIKGTIRDNLLLAAGWDTRFQRDETTLQTTLDQVGLFDQSLDKDVRSLSGGEQQRLALARGLLNQPEVLLLDEPTAQLDPPLARRILKTVSELTRDKQLSLVIVSHHPELIRSLVDDTVYLDRGRITNPPSS